MPVNLHLETKFPITSAPTPIPDPELYEEKALSDGRKVWISAPQPDRLRLVIPISHYVYAKHISPKLSVSDFLGKFVEHVTNPPLIGEVIGSSKFGFQSGDWKSTTLVFGKRDSRVYVTRTTEKGLGTCIRLDLNPRKLGPVGSAHLRQFLEALFDFPGLLESARIRRLDVAVDVVGLAVSEIVAHHGQQVKRTLYVGGDGQLETAYLHKKASKTKIPKDPDSPEKPILPNKPAGEVLVRVYDRVRFAKVQGKDAPFGEAPVTRIELVKSRFYEKNGNARLGKLAVMANPLAELRAGYAGTQITPLPWKWRPFLAMCWTQPPVVAAAALGMSDQEGEQLEAALKVKNPDLIEPAATWAKWSLGLKLTGLAQLIT